jgi:hypothetical protein
MGNILVAGIGGGGAHKYYKFSGFSSTISDSFSDQLASGYIGWDGTNALTSDVSYDTVNRHTGFSSTITASFDNPNWGLTGVTWDSANVISVNGGGDNMIVKFSGFSSTVVDSFVSPANQYPYGLCWDGTNVISDDYLGTGPKIYKNQGFSSTVADSFSSPSTQPYGEGFDGITYYSSDEITEKVYKHTGFTTTISDSFSTFQYVSSATDDSFDGSIPASTPEPNVFSSSSFSENIEMLNDLVGISQGPEIIGVRIF